MTDTPRRLLAYCMAVILGAFTLALTIAVFMHVGPGLLVVFPLAVVWWAHDMPVIDLDAELAQLLAEV